MELELKPGFVTYLYEIACTGITAYGKYSGKRNSILLLTTFSKYFQEKNEGTVREAPDPALEICHVHKSFLCRRAEVFVLVEVCLSRRTHAGQPKLDAIFSFH